MELLMTKFMFILMLVMAAKMGVFIIPIALVIWVMVKAFSWNDVVAEAKAKNIKGKIDAESAKMES